MGKKIEIPDFIMAQMEETYPSCTFDERRAIFMKMRRDTIAILSRNYGRTSAAEIFNKYLHVIVHTIPAQLSGHELATAIIWAENHPSMNEVRGNTPESRTKEAIN